MKHRNRIGSFLIVLAGAALSGRSAHAEGGGIPCPNHSGRDNRVQVWALEFQGARLNGQPVDDKHAFPVIPTGPDTQGIDLARFTDRQIMVPQFAYPASLESVRFTDGVEVVFEKEE